MNTSQTQFYTYLHCRPDGSPFYVGKGNRKRSHNFCNRNPHHKNVVEKYGRENIGIFIFPCESEEQAHADEIQQIAQLRREGYVLTNVCDGGEGASGCKPSEETRAKLSAARKGRKLSASHILRLVEVNTGKKLSAEHIAKMSAAKKGKKQSPEHIAKKVIAMTGKKRGPHSMETKAKISATKTGKKLSAEHRAKIVARLIGHPGVVHTVETRAKISQTKTGKKLGPQSAEHRAKIGLANSKNSPSFEVRARISATLKERARKKKENEDGISRNE